MRDVQGRVQTLTVALLGQLAASSRRPLIGGTGVVSTLGLHLSA